MGQEFWINMDDNFINYSVNIEIVIKVDDFNYLYLLNLWILI